MCQYLQPGLISCFYLFVLNSEFYICEGFFSPRWGMPVQITLACSFMPAPFFLISSELGWRPTLEWIHTQGAVWNVKKNNGTAPVLLLPTSYNYAHSSLIVSIRNWVDIPNLSLYYTSFSTLNEPNAFRHFVFNSFGSSQLDLHPVDYNFNLLHI